MAQLSFSGLVGKLSHDEAFRRQFTAAPAKTLEQAGLDPTLLALPAHLDYDSLTARLAQIGSVNVPSGSTGSLSADELWQRFGVIGLSKEAIGLISTDGTDSSSVVSATSTTTDITAVVIYGSSMATSDTVTTVTTVGGGFGAGSLDQLQALRSLAQHPRDQLTFSIAAPNGIAVHGVNADMIKAFLARSH